MADTVLKIEDLSIWYKTYRGMSKVVDHINMEVKRREKVGLVGESGCGKTTTMKTILRVIDEDIIHIPNGKILFNGQEVLKMSRQGGQKFSGYPAPLYGAPQYGACGQLAGDSHKFGKVPIEQGSGPAGI